MRPASPVLAEPTSPEAVRALLWGFLKRRLAERRAAGVGIGEAKGLHHRLPGPNSSEGDHGWPGDAPLGGDGRILLAGLVHAWPDSLRPRPETLAWLLDAVHNLDRQGVLRPTSDSGLNYIITHHGAAALDQDDADLPAGDSARVTRLRAEFAALPDLDLIARHYAEAIAAYDAGLDYSATVMIGVCYEAGLLLLAREVGAYERRAPGTVPGMNSRHKANIAKVEAGEYVPASAVESVVGDVLLGISEDLGGNLEWVKTCLRPTCHFVRSLRNSAGHPTGKAVPRDDVAAHILLLPGFLRRVASINGVVRHAL